MLRVTADIVAYRGPPLQIARPTPSDLVRHPSLKYYASPGSAEDLAPARLFEDIVRTIALERPAWPLTVEILHPRM